QCSQPEDSNELFQKLLKDLKELAEYEQSTSTDRPIFLNDNEDHPVQNKESPENSSEETVVSKTNQEPPQDSDIHQLIEECSIKFPEEQKQKMENTIITPETKSDEVTESNAENLLPIPSKCEVTLEDEIECDMPAKDVCSPVFTTFSNPLFKDNDDLNSSDEESLPDEDVPAEEFKTYSNPLCDEDEINSDKLDPHCFNVESDFVESLLNHDTFIDFSSKFDFSGELEEIDVVSETNDVLPPSDDDSNDEVDVVGDLRVDNVIQNSEHEYSESEDSDLDNPLLPLPPLEPPDKEFDFEIVFQKEILVRRNAIVKFNAKVKFGVFNDKNDVLSYFMFVIFAKEFSLLSAERGHDF
nr:hypothetical protein [Tanacetum cinerariifolium]